MNDSPQKSGKIRFIFDLDGTLTSEEILPCIARHFQMEEEISPLIEETLRGVIPYTESFIRRVFLLKKLPVDEVSALLAERPLFERLAEFIQKHPEICTVITGNLDVWVKGLISRISPSFYCSEAEMSENHVTKLVHIIKKENLVERFQNEGDRVVFIGDRTNDTEAMRLADVSIASGLVHAPSQSVLSVADYLIFDEETLCRQLNLLL
jgi:HAD superfamily phosphoserine phosphatase-like hydrolase